MTTIAELDCAITPTTDGEIAIINLESARQRSWARFFADPTRDGVAETVVEHEQLTLQFVGDLSALDRVEALAAQLNQIDAASARVALIQAQVASMAHRFSDARHYLAQAEIGGAPTADVDRLRLNIDQACGSNLDSVLDARRKIAHESRSGWKISSPLGLCWPIFANSMPPTVPTNKHCRRSGTYRRSPLPGFAFSSACFGENWYRSPSCPELRSGIGGRSPSCRCT